MLAKYISPIKRLGGIALVMFAFAIVFVNVAPGMVDENTRKAVLFNAIPFFAAFVGVLLLFILLIVILARRFNGKVPGRSYSGIERVIILGIISGVVCLFQPFSFVFYRYGFILLLIATLSFIVWSHVRPPTMREDARFAPLTRFQHTVGLIAGAVLIVAMVSFLSSMAIPREPYGVRQRAWDSYKADKKTAIAEAALSSYNSVELPFLVVFSAFPAAIVYFIVRESVSGKRRDEMVAV